MDFSIRKTNFYEFSFSPLCELYDKWKITGKGNFFYLAIQLLRNEAIPD